MPHNEPTPRSTQDSKHGRDSLKAGENFPTREKLSPELQAMVDQQEIDREIYADSWTNTTLNADEIPKCLETESRSCGLWSKKALPNDGEKKDEKD